MTAPVALEHLAFECLFETERAKHAHRRTGASWPSARAKDADQQAIAVRAQRRADADLALAAGDRERHQRVDAGGGQDRRR